MLKVFYYKNDNKIEIIPINGIYKVYELGVYQFVYETKDIICNNDVFLEDILIDNSLFNVQATNITSEKNCFFKDCFGFTSININNEIFNFNILIEKLKQIEVENILLFLWENENSLYDIFISKSSIKSEINKEGTDLGLTSKFLTYAKDFYKKMNNYWFHFKSLPHSVIRKKNEVVNYSPQFTTPDSINWLLENLDIVSFSPELRYHPDSIKLGSDYGLIEYIYTENDKISYKTYENEIILGGFVNILTKLSYLKRDILNNINVNEKFSEDNYVDFRDIKKVPYIKLLNDSQSIKKQLEKLFFKYKSIFPEVYPRNERPHITPVFAKSRHYMNAFNLINRGWNINFNFLGDLLLLNIQKMSHLYEVYNLYILLDAIQNTINTNYFKIEKEYNRTDQLLSKISYIRNDLYINLYYEQTYFHTKKTEIDLIRIDTTSGNYYRPDFILEIIISNKKTYCILDSKYSLQNAAKKRLGDCIFKYIINTGINNDPYKKADYLILLCPIDEDINYVTSNYYYPQIKILGSKPNKNESLKAILAEILKNKLPDSLLQKAEII